MKKLLFPAILLLAVTLISLFPAQLMAAEIAELAIVSAGAAKGESVTVTVVLGDGSDVCGGNFNICYDHTVLTLREAQLGSGLSSTAANINKNYTDNSARISFAGIQAVGGTLCTLSFDIAASAAPGDYQLTLSDVKFYDDDVQAVTPAVSNGAVTVQSTALVVETVEAVAQQSVQVKVSLGGDLRPAGGNFEIVYDPQKLTAGAVGKGSALSNSHQLSANCNSAAGIIKVIWAGDAAVANNGTLCSLTFDVAAAAVGDLALAVQNMRFYDENGKLLDSTITNGAVRVVAATEASPKLWVLGGAVDDEGNAEVGVLLEGRGVICGGQFTLLYDSTSCSLTSAVSGAADFGASSVINSPLTAGDNHSPAGTIRFSWAGATPSLEAQLLLKLKFQVTTTGSPLTLSSVKIVDGNAADVPAVDIRSGAIQKGGMILQVPQVDQISVAQGAVATQVNMTLDIADATKYRDDVASRQIQLLVAAYDNGRMVVTTFKSTEVRFDQYGLACIPAAVTLNSNADKVKVFFLSADGKMTPCSQFAFAELDAAAQ